MPTIYLTAGFLSGERVVWAGRPARGLLLSQSDIIFIPFSLLWGGISLSSAVTSISNRGIGLDTLPMAAFVVIGLYMIVGRFVVDAWAREGTRYLITDRRVLMARPAPFSKFTAVSFNPLPEVTFHGRANGRGTIRFGSVHSTWANRSGGSWSPAFDSTPQLLAIEDASSVFDLIQRTGAHS